MLHLHSMLLNNLPQIQPYSYSPLYKPENSLKICWRAKIWNHYLKVLSHQGINVSIQRFKVFPHSSVGKEPTCNAGDLGSILGLGWSPGEGIGYPLQYSGLENFMGRGAWQAMGVTKSQARLSDFHFFFHINFWVVTLCLVHYAYHIVSFQWMNAGTNP